MKVLIACEFSGIVRDEFLKLGHEALSCDILPTERNGPHYEGYVQNIINDGFDLMIAHPPCTYLCNSGVRWLWNRDGTADQDRWIELAFAYDFFMELWEANISKICIENPIPHKYGKLPKYSQIIQPWMFGHGETKATCLWLKNLPKLTPTNIVDGRENKIHKIGPSKNRWKDRSRTYKGIAEAMAKQWSGE